MDILNGKMIMTGLVKRCITWEVIIMKELDRQDVRKRPGGIVLRMTWKV